MHKNSYIRSLTEEQVLSYILRSIFEGKNTDQIAERFDGDTKLIKTWVVSGVPRVEAPPEIFQVQPFVHCATVVA
jgi:hypothetical protein